MGCFHIKTKRHHYQLHIWSYHGTYAYMALRRECNDQKQSFADVLQNRVFVFPGLRPFAWSLASAPNLFLPALVPNLYLPALAPNLYLPTLAPNLYLPALAPTIDLHLPVQVKILLLPQLLSILFTTSTINITASSTTTTTATTTATTTNYKNDNKKCICGSKIRIK